MSPTPAGTQCRTKQKSQARFKKSPGKLEKNLHWPHTHTHKHTVKGEKHGPHTPSTPPPPHAQPAREEPGGRSRGRGGVEAPGERGVLGRSVVHRREVLGLLPWPRRRMGWEPSDEGDRGAKVTLGRDSGTQICGSVNPIPCGLGSGAVFRLAHGMEWMGLGEGSGGSGGANTNPRKWGRQRSVGWTPFVLNIRLA